MSTYRELIHMVLDSIKGRSDDFTFNEYHVKFLLDKYRALLLKNRYQRNTNINEANYSEIQVDLIKEVTCDKTLLKTSIQIPYPIIGDVKVHLLGPNMGDTVHTSYNAFKYVGSGKFSSSTLYSAYFPDRHIYFKSSNSQFLHLENVLIRGVFDNREHITDLDSDFNTEEALIPQILDQVIKQLLQAEYYTDDSTNNAKDDIPDKMLMANAALQRRRPRYGNETQNQEDY